VAVRRRRKSVLPARSTQQEQRRPPLAEETFDQTRMGRQNVTVVETNDGTKLVGIVKQVKLKDHKGNVIYVPRRGKQFYLPLRKVGRLLEVLRRILEKFGWKLEETESERRIGELNAKIDEMNLQFLALQSNMAAIEKQRAEYEAQLKVLSAEIVKSNLQNFRQDLVEFRDKLDQASKGALPEEEVQKFLKDRPWIFGVEFIKSEPKKPAGSKSIFDFYLLDYQKHGIVIELKKPSEQIFSDEYTLTQRVTDGLGQLIRYLETTIAIAYSTEMSRIEGIVETKPQGYLIIGRKRSTQQGEQLHKINSYLHRIRIETYDDLLAKGETALATFSAE